MRFDNDKTSPLNYSVALRTEHFGTSRFYNMNSGFMRDATDINYELFCFPYCISAPSDHLDYLQNLKEFYANNIRDGINKVVDMFRVEELDYFINNYEDSVSFLLSDSSNFDYGTHFENLLSSQRYCHDSPPGFFITFPDNYIGGGAENKISIIKSNVALEETKQFYETLSNNGNNHQNMIFRRLSDKMVPLIKGMPYKSISIDECV
jgi:hypothetical protein